MSYYKVGTKVNFKKQRLIDSALEGAFVASLMVGFIVGVLIP